MLAVFAPAVEVAGLIQDHGLDVVIANKNAPSQCVLSGPRPRSSARPELFADRGSPPGRSPSRRRSTAGSSERPADGLPRRAWTGCWRPATIPVFANATGGRIPRTPTPHATCWPTSSRRPVEFVAQVEAMYRMGARTFLEVGPDSKLTGLVRSILEGTRPRRGRRRLDARRYGRGEPRRPGAALANLAALGYPVELDRWDDGYRDAASPTPQGPDGEGLRSPSRPRKPTDAVAKARG